MRKHIHFGRGHSVLKQHIQHALHSHANSNHISHHLSHHLSHISHESHGEGSHLHKKHAGKKISPLRFKF